jgi:hypothetical protein
MGVIMGLLSQLLVGCGTKPKPGLSEAPAGTLRVTLYVEGMTKKLDITCPD